MKHLNTYITEYIVKKKLDKFIDSEDQYKYTPKTKEELIDNISELLDNGKTDLNCINTSNITDMSHLFELCKNVSNNDFDVSRWNVSNVTDMVSVFENCTNFDCDLSNWDVSKVTNMGYMFADCKKFKGKDLDKWNPVNVKNVRVMFGDCDMKDKPKWYYDKYYKNKKK